MHYDQLVTVLVQWVGSTSLSGSLAQRPWIIPLLQSIHIVCVGLVIAAVTFVNLRLIGVFARDLSTAAVCRRFLPWMWWTMPVLLLTGVFLTIAEPARELQNSTFQLKMLLILGALLLAAVIQTRLSRDDLVWQVSNYKRRIRQLVAALSIAVWVGIVCAGRMIAYTQTG